MKRKHTPCIFSSVPATPSAIAAHVMAVTPAVSTRVARRKSAFRCDLASFSVIEDQGVIKKILKHLGLWELKPRPPPKATRPTKMIEYSIDYSTTQLPASDNLSRASRSNKWLYVDPEYPEGYPPLEGHPA